MTAGKRTRLPGLIFVGVLLLCLFTGCATGQEDSAGEPEAETGNENETEKEEDTELDTEAGTSQEDTGLYILLYSNPDTQKLFVESVDTGRQEEFDYNGGTYIYSRYGDSTTISQIPVGALVYLTEAEKNQLTQVQEAQDTFVYQDITGFELDTEESILTMMGSNYYYNEDMKVFSEEGIIGLNELGSQDAIDVRGIGKQVLTIVVSKGHGTVSLKHTELFEGGMITIGNVEARTITPDMKLEVPEGTYTLSVANDGYGGSREITVERFQELEVDLDALKGDGPSYCTLVIIPEPPEAVVTLNGEAVNCSSPMVVKYGVYSVTAQAEGYEDWSGKLVVSSADAEITITLESSESSSDDSSDDDSSTDSENEADTTVTTS